MDCFLFWWNIFLLFWRQKELLHGRWWRSLIAVRWVIQNCRYFRCLRFIRIWHEISRLWKPFWLIEFRSIFAVFLFQKLSLFLRMMQHFRWCASMGTYFQTNEFKQLLRLVCCFWAASILTIILEIHEVLYQQRLLWNLCLLSTRRWLVSFGVIIILCCFLVRLIIALTSYSF